MNITKQQVTIKTINYVIQIASSYLHYISNINYI